MQILLLDFLSDFLGLHFFFILAHLPCSLSHDWCAGYRLDEGYGRPNSVWELHPAEPPLSVGVAMAAVVIVPPPLPLYHQTSFSATKKNNFIVSLSHTPKGHKNDSGSFWYINIEILMINLDTASTIAKYFNTFPFIATVKRCIIFSTLIEAARYFLLPMRNFARRYRFAVLRLLTLELTWLQQHLQTPLPFSELSEIALFALRSLNVELTCRFALRRFRILTGTANM